MDQIIYDIFRTFHTTKAGRSALLLLTQMLDNQLAALAVAQIASKRIGRQYKVEPGALRVLSLIKYFETQGVPPSIRNLNASGLLRFTHLRTYRTQLREAGLVEWASKRGRATIVRTTAQGVLCLSALEREVRTQVEKLTTLCFTPSS